MQAQVAESKSRVATEEVVGTVRAKLHSVIEAKVSGKIEQMLVVPGQNVTDGELLVRLTRAKFRRNSIRPSPCASRRKAI